jgi:hypothetical protein
MNWLQKAGNRERPTVGQVALNVCTLGFADLVRAAFPKGSAGRVNQNLAILTRSALNPMSPNSRGTVMVWAEGDQVSIQSPDGTIYTATKTQSLKLLDVHVKKGDVDPEVARALVEAIQNA